MTLHRRSLQLQQHSLVSVAAINLLLLAILSQPVLADSIFADGNLILVNPLQSSVIFISIIVSSVALEFIVGKVDFMTNKYLKVALSLFMEEVMVLGLVEVCLLTARSAISNIGPTMELEFNIVALTLVFMALLYGIISSALAVKLQSKGRDWRNFEWGRLEADAQHSTVEGLFKHGRTYFIILLRRSMRSNQTIREIPAVAFAVFLGRVERRYLRVIFDITFLSWGGLGLMVILNMCRSLIVGTDRLIWEVQSFILLVGYGTATASAILAFMVSRRLKRFLKDAIAAHHVTDAVVDARVTQLPADGALAFGSFGATLQLYKIFHLIMMWYLAMYVVVEAKLSYDGHGWYCILVAVEALIPVVVFYVRYPTSVFVPLIAVALGRHVNEDAIEGLKRGCNVDDSSSDDDDDIDEDDRFEKIAAAAGATQRMDSVRVGPALSRPLPSSSMATAINQQGGTIRLRHDNDDERIPCDDEVDDDFGTFHDGVPEDQAPPPGEPPRVMGVPPTNAMQKRKWNVKKLEPVFL
jgi:hypothetical protein